MELNADLSPVLVTGARAMGRHLKELMHLSISKSGIETSGIEAIATNMRRLRYLDISTSPVPLRLQRYWNRGSRSNLPKPEFADYFEHRYAVTRLR